MPVKKSRKKNKKAKRISLLERKNPMLKLVEVVESEISPSAQALCADPIFETGYPSEASVKQSDAEHILAVLHAVSTEADAASALDVSVACDSPSLGASDSPSPASSDSPSPAECDSPSSPATSDSPSPGSSSSLSPSTCDESMYTPPEVQIVDALHAPTEVAHRKNLPAWLQGVLEFEQYLDANFRSIRSWIWSLRAPLLLLFAIAVQPKMILLWIVIVVAKPIGTFLFERCPPTWKERLTESMPAPIRNSPLLRDLGEGADQGLPFILFWSYIFCAPFAITWIGMHWVRSFWQGPSDEDRKVEGGFVFAQNRRLDAVHSEVNFYYSRAFSVVLLAFFALGIPAFISYAIFENLGVAKTMSSARAVNVRKEPRIAPQPYVWEMGVASRKPHNSTPIKVAPMGIDSTVVLGYKGDWPFLRNFGLEPTKSSLVFVHFYLVSLASVFSILFFRAWFLFPLNFLTDDHDVEVTESGVKRKSMMRSWFLSVVTFNRWAIGSGADSLRWEEVKSLRQLEEGFFKLAPLPETAFKRESLAYKLLNKVAVLIDGLSSRPCAGNYLVFSASADKSDFGRNIKINLNDLSREQRARLYYAVKTWAPHVVVDSVAEKQLIGSNVLASNQYTQLWFDILTSRTPKNRSNVLCDGESLKGGEYVVESRISSGGQATTYLARNAAGRKCALKEFILSTSTASGAVIESAREFEAEVSLLSQLNHTGIVKLEDFFSEGGRLYVVMEYIDGQSLRQKVSIEGPLPQHEVVRIALATCDVLSYLHTCNPPIVHRDITPENILLDVDGNVKVIDFSLAVKQDGRQTTDSCAKQAFTPPEQFREEVCVSSDIYSLGATMHFLLTGRTPKPISVSSPKLVKDNVSDELNAIVERATQLDLDKRYEAVDWLEVDLAAARGDADDERPSVTLRR